jgi:hypothetical protein
MAKLHSERVAEYEIYGRKVDVYLCWQGDDPGEDRDRFYDLFDEEGFCLNEGTPWHDDDEGVPSKELVEDAFGHWKKEAKDGS